MARAVGLDPHKQLFCSYFPGFDFIRLWRTHNIRCKRRKQLFIFCANYKKDVRKPDHAIVEVEYRKQWSRIKKSDTTAHSRGSGFADMYDTGRTGVALGGEDRAKNPKRGAACGMFGGARRTGGVSDRLPRPRSGKANHAVRRLAAEFKKGVTAR